MENSNQLLDKYQSLIGKELKAYSWHYDNDGYAQGKITDIKFSQYINGGINVYINPSLVGSGSMDYFNFTINQIDTLLKDGKLPDPNKFLNTGTEASIL